MRESSLHTERFNSKLKRWIMSWSADINIKRLSRSIIVIVVRLADGFMRAHSLVQVNNANYYAPIQQIFIILSEIL